MGIEPKIASQKELIRHLICELKDLAEKEKVTGRYLINQRIQDIHSFCYWSIFAHFSFYEYPLWMYVCNAPFNFNILKYQKISEEQFEKDKLHYITIFINDIILFLFEEIYGRKSKV